MVKLEKEELEGKIKYWAWRCIYEKENILLLYDHDHSIKWFHLYTQEIIQAQDALEKIENGQA